MSDLAQRAEGAQVRGLRPLAAEASAARTPDGDVPDDPRDLEELDRQLREVAADRNRLAEFQGQTLARDLGHTPDPDAVQRVARAMAENDGEDWRDLEDWMRASYMEVAEVAVRALTDGGQR